MIISGDFHSGTAEGGPTCDEDQAGRECPSRPGCHPEKLGHDVHTTLEEGLAGRSDEDIWAASQSEKRFLLTQDLDFSEICGDLHPARITGYF
ncbi:MAG: DUF5615 family PIN-like protein [Acidobacteria bacterium]|nr:DUF5615 family PIN-like protein [Acidobacteriota bacterium]